MTVSDDGKGIPQGIAAGGQVPGHWGVKGMRERADRLGGKIEYDKRNGQGTTLRLVITNQTRHTGKIGRVLLKMRKALHPHSIDKLRS